MDTFLIHNALESIWKLISECNSYVEVSAPWKLAKDPDQSALLDEVLYRLADTLRVIALLVSPVLPKASQAMFDQLQWQPTAGATLSELVAMTLPSGHTLGEPSPLFPRIETEK